MEILNAPPIQVESGILKHLQLTEHEMFYIKKQSVVKRDNRITSWQTPHEMIWEGEGTFTKTSHEMI